MTYLRIFVAALPCRWLARYAFTAWCITGMLTVPSNTVPGSGTLSRAVPCAVYAAACSDVAVVLSAMRVSWSSALLPYDHDAARLPGDRAADVDQIAIRVDLLDAEMGLGVALVAIVARHALALDDARRIGARPDGTGTTVLGVAV